MTGDSSSQRIIEINYIPSSSPNFEPYNQIDGFKCSSRISSSKTLNFTVEVERDFAYRYGRPTLFPSGLLSRVDRKTHGSISYFPEQRDVHCVFMYRRTDRWWEAKYIFIALGPYPDQEDFYCREPWIDVFVSDDEYLISDVWESYLPSGSRYGRRQHADRRRRRNSGATAAVDDSTSVTVTMEGKIWDDPVYYYIILEENDKQTGATMEGLTDGAQTEWVDDWQWETV
ncbi:hypothetical protein K435DRAFT_855371 [Dendrothele bispora CBS 962.96]|uniref:Uncharacterized protein n=1 Tax=Dendrothele bispora (strain CBS 962.96) TaxID=1314807 RepID=A0A4S8MB83_DENBC|nr:hypothetical protein K435DRAFT_855371 [Dendrothele bispora CBS 962.96]